MVVPSCFSLWRGMKFWKEWTVLQKGSNLLFCRIAENSVSLSSLSYPSLNCTTIASFVSIFPSPPLLACTCYRYFHLLSFSVFWR